MLSDRYPVIIGIPPHRLSEEARGLFVFCSGRDIHAGRQRLSEDDVVTEDIETTRNNRQVSHAEVRKSRPATQSRASTAAAANIAGASPNPTYDDFELLLPDGNLAVPPCKTGPQNEVTVTSMPYIQAFDNEDDDPIRELSPIFPHKTRAKTHGRAARKLIVWSTDEDEMEGEGDRRNQVDYAKGEINTSKRKQRDDTDGVASKHQPKRVRTTTRVTDVVASKHQPKRARTTTRVTDVNTSTPVRDAFVRTSHGKGKKAFIVQRCSHS